MKRIVFNIIVVLLLSGSKSFSQSIDLPADSVASLLCKKWEIDYAMMGEMVIGKLPNAPDINYEFYKDKTFLMTSDDPKDKIKGVWAYDAKKKTIKLTINGKGDSNIISLKKGELIMLEDTREVTPEDLTVIKLVFKVKTK